MWNKTAKKSGAESGQPEKNSVFDIFYHDPRRIGSFLSQFVPSGHLQSITEGTSVNDAEHSKGGFEGKVSLPLVAEARVPMEIGATSSTSESASKTYDPIWANALAFLDYLHQEDLIVDDIEVARIGQFVQASGELVIIDLEFLQRMYRMGELQDRARNFPNPETGEIRPAADVDIDLYALQNVPPQLQMYITPAGETPIYGGLKSDGLASPVGDLFMKYGHHITGEWTVVGIKDAEPEGTAEEVLSAKTNLAAKVQSAFLNEYMMVSGRLRAWLGRQPSCYGITPLIILRQIGGN